LPVAPIGPPHYLAATAERIIGSNEHGDVEADEIGGQTWELVIASLREPKFDRDILIFDEARLRQAAANRGKQRRLRVRGPAAEITNARRRRLLRARRPGNRRATQECDEVAPSHAKLPVKDKAYQRAACDGAALARTFRVAAALVGCGHVSGLFVRR